VLRAKPLALMGAAMLLGSFAAPGASMASAAPKHVTITFMEAMSSGTLVKAMQALTQQFNRSHPGITVELIPEPSYSVLAEKEQAAIAAGNPPTIGQAYEDWAATYAASKAIVPLTGFVNGKNGVSAAYKADMWPEIWRDQFLPDGKMWMWPFNKSDFVMYYNATWLQQLKANPPKTWSQLGALAETVTNKSKGTWGLSMDPGGTSGPANGTYVYVALLRAFGGHLMQHGRIAWASPAGVKAMEFLKTLYDKGALQLGTNYPGQTALDAGHTLFDLSTIASYYYIATGKSGNFTVGTAPFPAGPAGEGNVLQGTNIVMFARSTAAQKEAAWTFMKWLTEPAQTAYWATHTGYLPVVRSALHLMKGYYATHPYQKIAAESLAYARPVPPVPGFEQATGILGEAIQEVLTQNVPPMTALKQAAQQGQQALASSGG
jgi:multiple sugar transport system substrate-binding protein